MPYFIDRVPGGYKVGREARDGIAYFSHEPLTKHMVEAQLRALLTHTNHGLYMENETDLYGHGISDVFRKIKNVFTNEYSPATEAFMKKYGPWELGVFRIHREPVQPILVSLLDKISFGKFKAKVSEKYDDVFHLFMNFEIINPATREVKYIQTEKTPNIEFNEVQGLRSKKQDNAAWPFLETGTWAEGSFPKSRTVQMLVTAAQKILGDKFQKYNPYDNNCQVWIKTLLNGQGVMDFDSFIYQPLEGILTGHTKAVASTVTDLGHLANRILGRKIPESSIYELAAGVIPYLAEFEKKHFKKK